jgi:PAS domain S-box-containing protein
MEQTRSESLLRYGLAVGLAVLALLLSMLFRLQFKQGVFVIPLAAVVISAWYGGRGPGLVTMLLSVVAVEFLLLRPAESLAAAPLANAIGLIVFAAVGLLLIEFSAARHRSERALRESQQRWQAVFEHNPTMYAMVDAGGTMLAVNPFAAEQLGYTVDELVGRPHLDVFHEADREDLQKNVDICMERLGQAMSWEFRKVRKDGTVLWVRETAKAVRMAAQKDPVLVVACQDITERKDAEEALQNVQAELAHVARVATMGELAASIAHEVNQPLTAVVTNGDACLRWLDGPSPNLEEARRSAQHIIRDGRRAGEILHRIRGLVKKTDPHKTWLDMSEVTREVVTLARGELLRHRVVLRTELADDLPPVLGDRIQLQQVILNLILNSIEAMDAVEEGVRELLIRAQRNDSGGVRIEVHDRGVGIDPQDAERIFDVF